MNLDAFRVRTRGGLLVMFVVVSVLFFELRTAAGMFLGIDIPALPYFVGVLALLVVLTILADIDRATMMGRD